MTEQPPQGELLCGEDVQYANTPAWVAELPLAELPTGPSRLYLLYCGRANGRDGLVWINSLRATVKDWLGCTDRSIRTWEKLLEDFGLIKKIGRYRVRVHRGKDDIMEAQKQNAGLGEGRRRAGTRKRKQPACVSRPKIKHDDEVPPLFRWADGERKSASAPNDTKRKSASASESTERKSASAPAERTFRDTHKSEKNSDSPLQAGNGNANGPSPTNEEASRLAKQLGVNPQLCKEALEHVHQVRMRIGSGAVFAVERESRHSHPKDGEGYIGAVVDACRDRLIGLDEREATAAERAGELVIDEAAIELEEIPF